MPRATRKEPPAKPAVHVKLGTDALVELKPPAVSAKSRINDTQKAAKGTDATKGKPRAGAGSRNAGKLSKFLSMPLDVIFEIVCQLKLVDLLQLSRVSKDFRREFASRSSTRLWVAIRKSMADMPAPPPYVSEPKYAALLFEHSCYACGVGRSPKLCHALMLRLCGACWKLNIKQGSKLLRRGDPEEVLALLTAAEGVEWVFEGETQLPRNDRFNNYYVPEFNAVLARYSALSGKDRETFVEGRKKHVLATYRHARDAHAWELRVLEEKQDVCKSRQETIEERLVEMGYSKTDFPETYDEEWDSLVNQPRPLTARIWKKIQPQLMEIIKREKETRIQRVKDELRNARFGPLFERYKLYVETVPEDEGPLPPCDMLALTEPVKALMDREDDGLPLDDAEMDAAIPEAATRYSAEARHALLSSLREASRLARIPPLPDTPTESDDEDVSNVSIGHEEFRRGIAFFRCDFCVGYVDPLRFTDLVRHIREQHLQSTTPAWRLAKWPLEYNKSLTYPCAHVQAVQVAIQALRHLHLPETTLIEQVDDRLGGLRDEWRFDQVPTSFDDFVRRKCQP